MADYDALTYFHLQGLFNGITADTVGLFGDAGPEPDIFNVNMDATLSYALPGPDGKPSPLPPELRLTTATPPRTLLLLPVGARIESGVLRLPGADTGVDGVDLVARSAMLPIAAPTPLLCMVQFGTATIGGKAFAFDPITFVVPTVEAVDYHANVTQTVTVNGAPDGGHYALVYGTAPTLNITPGVPASTIQSALITAVNQQLLTSFAAPLSVAGPNGGPFVVTFNTANIPRPLRLGVINNLTSTAFTFPNVTVTDAFAMATVDLTTVARWPS